MKIKCIGQLAIIQQDIENLHKEVKELRKLIKIILKEGKYNYKGEKNE